ncbi:hypothetical protein ACFTXM_14820 [Streptomyces sp. NPDC056930]|uniref:hypothetical protein n=1 Tax=Streptomyces sp. NPDC056930 TaxID=3345967 RepID=UPI003638080C
MSVRVEDAGHDNDDPRLGGGCVTGLHPAGRHMGHLAGVGGDIGVLKAVRGRTYSS